MTHLGEWIARLVMTATSIEASAAPRETSPERQTDSVESKTGTKAADLVMHQNPQQHAKCDRTDEPCEHRASLRPATFQTLPSPKPNHPFVCTQRKGGPIVGYLISDTTFEPSVFCADRLESPCVHPRRHDRVTVRLRAFFAVDVNGVDVALLATGSVDGRVGDRH